MAIARYFIKLNTALILTMTCLQGLKDHLFFPENLFRFFLHVIQYRIQTLIPFLPHFLEGRDPVGNFRQFLKIGFTIPFPAGLFDNDNPAFGQDLNMLGNSRATYIKIVCNRIQIE